METLNLGIVATLFPLASERSRSESLKIAVSRWKAWPGWGEEMEATTGMEMWLIYAGGLMMFLGLEGIELTRVSPPVMHWFC